MAWMAIAGAVIGGIGDDRDEDKYGKLAQATEANRGALERQNDAQEWELFLLERRDEQIVGLGNAVNSDFWSGANNPEVQGQIAGFFDTMSTTKEFTGGQGNQSRAPDIGLLSQAGQADVNASMAYNVRDEFDNPLYNLRNFLGLDTRRGYNPDGQRANAPAPYPREAQTYLDTGD